MTAHSKLRLLPWSGPNGKPCYLSTDANSSHLSRLADTMEATQLDLAHTLVTHTLEVIDDEETDLEELRSLSADLVEALQDAIRVAKSRGYRLATSND
ncbi:MULTISPECIES: hypothetical protein [Streptomyces]|uniref:hypothetical protein n=1 Tax=Streptomyces TaxID=1883 RepID=UPI0028DC146D|nr:hypothetical protein [Streptomyces sp. DSM 40976]